MRVRIAGCGALLFTVLALIPAGAHVAELPHKIRLNGADYRTVQQIYQGWALFGIVVFGALVSTLLLVLAVQRQRAAFMASLIALASIVGTQIIFWSLTYPVNRATVNWTTLPLNWTALRSQWEYSHAAAAGLNLVAFIAVVVTVLLQIPRHRARA